jgi:hypothetical protein
MLNDSWAGRNPTNGCSGDWNSNSIKWLVFITKNERVYCGSRRLMFTILRNFSIQTINCYLENTIFTRRKRNKSEKQNSSAG